MLPQPFTCSPKKPSQSVSKPTIKGLLTALSSGEIEASSIPQLQHMWTSMKITIGSLIVRGYRMFKYMLEEECVVFVKREEMGTGYLLLRVVWGTGEAEGEGDLVEIKDKQEGKEDSRKNFGEDVRLDQFCADVLNCVGRIQKFRGKSLESFTIAILFGLDYTLLQIKVTNQIRTILQQHSTILNNENKNPHNLNLNSNQIQQQQNLKLSKQQSQIITKTTFIQLLPSESYTLDCYAQTYTQEEINLSANPEQHHKLKQIIYSYIDTFGQKSKTTYYKELTKKSLYLINTINLLIFEQTRPNPKSGQPQAPPYTQLESACWTAFKTGRLESDRKDIVLSGNGRILFLDLTFAYNLTEYVNQAYCTEVEELLKECKNAYVEAKVKVVKIENSLTKRHVYSYYSKLVDLFSKVEVVV